MADVVNNSVGYDAGAVGAGPGAAVLSMPTQLFAANQKWNEQTASDEEAAAKEQLQRKLDSKAILQDINPDIKGSLDSDADYFRNGVNDVLTKKAQLYGKYNGDLSSPAAGLEMQNLKAQEQNLKQEAYQSASHKDLLLKADQRLESDKGIGEFNNDATVARMAQLRATPLRDRQKLLDSWGGDVMVQNPLNLNKELARSRATLKPNVSSTTAMTDANGKVLIGVDGRPITTTTTGVDERQLTLHGKQSYLSDTLVQKAADQEWQQLKKDNPAAAADLEEEVRQKNAQAIANGQPENTIVNPAQLLAIKANLPYAYKQEKQKIGPESEASKYGWWQRKWDYKVAHPQVNDRYQYQQMVNGIAGDENVWDKTTVNPDGTLTLSGSPLQGMSQGKTTIPEYTLKNIDGTLTSVPTGNVKVVDNEVMDTKADGQIGKDGHFYVSNPRHVTMESVAKHGYNPADVTPKWLEEHPEVYEPTTVNHVDKAAMAAKLKLNKEDYYKGGNATGQNAYQGSRPHPEKAAVVDTRGKIPVSEGGKTNTGGSKLQSALAAFKQQFNREPTAKELEKIKAKYGQ